MTKLHSEIVYEIELIRNGDNHQTYLISNFDEKLKYY
jgi:hypothetical protein